MVTPNRGELAPRKKTSLFRGSHDDYTSALIEDRLALVCSVERGGVYD
jgi:hypothetical protein